jgi:uncharacterized membrane protein
MSNLSNAKVFGGIGALLSLIGPFIPVAGSVVFIIGLVLIFLGIKNIADETKNKSIFDNYLYYFILNIIAIVAIVAIMFASLGSIDIFNIQEQAQNITDLTTFWDTFGGLVTGCILAIFVGWIFMIIAALFLRKSYNSITEHTKVDLFKTTALINLIGAITLIIVIGGLIIIVAKIIEIVAFFSLPDTLPKATKTSETREAPES